MLLYPFLAMDVTLEAALFNNRADAIGRRPDPFVKLTMANSHQTAVTAADSVVGKTTQLYVRPESVSRTSGSIPSETMTISQVIGGKYRWHSTEKLRNGCALPRRGYVCLASGCAGEGGGRNGGDGGRLGGDGGRVGRASEIDLDPPSYGAVYMHVFTAILVRIIFGGRGHPTSSRALFGSDHLQSLDDIHSIEAVAGSGRARGPASTFFGTRVPGCRAPRHVASLWTRAFVYMHYVVISRQYLPPFSAWTVRPEHPRECYSRDGSGALTALFRATPILSESKQRGPVVAAIGPARRICAESGRDLQLITSDLKWDYTTPCIPILHNPGTCPVFPLDMHRYIIPGCLELTNCECQICH